MKKILKFALLSIAGLVPLCVIVLLAMGGWWGTTHLENDIGSRKSGSWTIPPWASGSR